MNFLTTELAVIIALLIKIYFTLYAELHSDRKQLKKIRKILRYGIRTFPLPVRLVFLNSEGKEMTQMNILDSGQIFTPALSAVDVVGNPAPLDPASVPVYSLDDTSMGSVDPASGVFTPSGKLGSVNLDASIPAINAQPALAGSFLLVVTAGAAVALSISGAVSAAPVAAPAAPSS